MSDVSYVLRETRLKTFKCYVALFGNFIERMNLHSFFMTVELEVRS